MAAPHPLTSSARWRATCPPGTARHASQRCAAASAKQERSPPPVWIEDAASAAFLASERAAGVACSRLKLAEFAGVRGMAATADIQADELLVSVPRAAALTLPPKQRCPCPEFVTPAFWDASPWFVKLGVRLLAEQRKGLASPYAAWLSQLPRAVDAPVNWSQEQLQQLGYPSLIHKVTEQQNEWASHYERLLAGGLTGCAAPPPSKQEFFRALSLVRSRTFSGPYIASTLQDRLRLAGLVAGLVAANTAAGGELATSLGAAAAVFLFNIIYELVLSSKLRQYAMCPVIDLLNHSSTNATEVSYDYPQDAFLVASGAAYAPGQQVFVSYGAQGNDSLLQYYGFVEPDCPYDAHASTSLLTWLEQLQPPSQARLDALNSAGLLGALQEVSITRQGFGSETLSALRFLLAPGAGAANLPAGPPSRYEQPADEATEQRLALVLVHVCQCELAVLGAADSSSSSSSSSRPGRSKAMASAFRAEKRKVLAACLQKLTGADAPAAVAAPGDGSNASSGRAQTAPAALQ